MKQDTEQTWIIKHKDEVEAEKTATDELINELLEALLDARYMLYGNNPVGNPKIDAAIAKAKGQAT